MYGHRGAGSPPIPTICGSAIPPSVVARTRVQAHRRWPGGRSLRDWSIPSRRFPMSVATVMPRSVRDKIPASMRFVYDFDEPCEGGRELLGGKGIGLAEMTQLGVPVPAGFTITTEACRAYMRAGGRMPDGLDEEIAEDVAALEAKDRN